MPIPRQRTGQPHIPRSEGDPTVRPYTICHLLCSLDGKISGAFMGSPAAATGREAYGRLANDFQCQATVYGTTTMLDFCPGFYDEDTATTPDAAASLDPRTAEDFVADPDAASYIVSLDRRGRLAYDGPTMTRRGKTSHLIVALTRRTSADYLDYLRRAGISYVFCGEDDIDCAQLMEKLAGHFGIKRALVAGGGRIDWSFLAAGCLDEVSLVVAPVVDGTPDAATIFERTDSHEHAPAAPLTLASTENLGKSTLWLRYNAEAD